MYVELDPNCFDFIVAENPVEKLSSNLDLSIFVVPL